MKYCEGCNTQYGDTGCGEDLEHAECPQSCGLCGKPITGRDTPGSCASHTIAEARTAVNELRRRTSR
jgi:hypothetical protein